MRQRLRVPRVGRGTQVEAVEACVLIAGQPAQAHVAAAEDEYQAEEAEAPGGGAT